MKGKLYLLSLAALSLAFTACQSNKDLPVSETDATLSVVLKTATTRTYYEEADGKDDMKVSNLAAMVYDGDAQVAYKEAAAGALEVKDIETTAGNKTLVVVANYGNKALKGVSLPDLKAMTHELAANDQDPTKETLIITSEPTKVTLQKGKNYYGYDENPNNGEGNVVEKDPLEIVHVHAGMSLVGVTVKFAESYKDLYSVSFEKDAALVALIAHKTSKIVGNPLSVADAYLYGEKQFGASDKKYTPTDENKYTDAPFLKMDISGKVQDKMEGFGFYVLENNEQAHPTILALKGTLKNADGQDLTEDQKKQAAAAGWIVSKDDASTFYPVLVNWEDPSYTFDGVEKHEGIVRGYKYQISLTITGPGTGKPEEPKPGKANLDVMCKVAPWKIVKQTVVWP